MLPVLLGTAIRAGARDAAIHFGVRAASMGARELAEKDATHLARGNGAAGAGISDRISDLLKDQSTGRGGIALDMVKAALPGGPVVGEMVVKANEIACEGRANAMKALGNFQPNLGPALEAGERLGLSKPKYGMGNK